MGEKSQGSSEREKFGCMWGLMSMFNFGNVGSNQKLLVDQRRSKRDASTDCVNARNAPRNLRSSNDNSIESLDGDNGDAAPGECKQSVKKLIEEEMFTEQECKKPMWIDRARKPSGSEHKLSRRNNKHRSKSCDSIQNVDAELESRHNLSHRCSSSREMERATEEPNSEIPQRTGSFALREWLGEPQFQSDYEERLGDLLKLLVDQNPSDGNCATERGNCCLEDLREMVQVLCSDEELFMKLLHDPDSLLLHDAQEKHLVPPQKRRFLWWKRKPQEKKPFVGSNRSQASDRIVILKPATKSLSSSQSGTSLDLLTESVSANNARQNERSSSGFFLSRIKRKLQRVVGKEHQASRSIERMIGDKALKHNSAKEHSREENGAITLRNPINLRTRTDCESENSKKEVSNIYIEAKKHLSEMLHNRALDANLSSKSVPTILGRILSLPGYFSPSRSPAVNSEHNSFVSRHMTSPKKHESCLSSLAETAHEQEAQICISDERSDITEDPLDLGSDNLVDENIVEVRESSTEVPMEAAKGAEIIAQEDSDVSDASPEPCNSLSTQNDQRDNSSEIDDRKEDSQKMNLVAESQAPSSPEGSPSNPSIARLGCEEIVTNVPGRSSPVSVLEPLFTDDDISPASTSSRHVEMRMQPLCIQFEEYDSPAEQRGNYTKNVMVDKESIFEYVELVIKASNLNREELFMRPFSPDQLLELSLAQSLELFPNQLCSDRRLLFDCINEVLRDICSYRFGCSFSKSKTSYVPDLQNVIDDTQAGVYWHLVPVPFPCTLDQLISKDMHKAGSWMNLQFDTVCISIEISEVILHELLEEIVEKSITAGWFREPYTMCQTELKYEGSNISS